MKSHYCRKVPLLIVLALVLSSLQLTCLADNSYDISVLPVLAYYVEIEPGDYSEQYRLRGKEGWHLLILDVAIFNNTKSFLRPDWTYNENRQRELFKLFTNDGYEYEGIMSDNPTILSEGLPPMYCLFNYFRENSSGITGYSQTWVYTPSLAFFVPTSITEYSFSYNSESPGIPIDFDEYSGAMYGSAYSAIQERVKSYPQYYSTNVNNATIELERGITLFFEECTTSSFGLDALFSVNNDTGYDFQMRDLNISIIDNNGISYGTQNPELTIPPKGTKSFAYEYSWRDIPEGIELNPKVILIRTNQNTYLQRVNEQQGDFSHIDDLNRMGNRIISQLLKSDIYIDNSKLDVTRELTSFIGFFIANNIMYIYNRYGITQIINLDTGKSLDVSIDYGYGEIIDRIDDKVVYSSRNGLFILDAQGTQEKLDISNYDEIIGGMRSDDRIYTLSSPGYSTDHGDYTIKEFDISAKKTTELLLTEFPQGSFSAQNGEVYIALEDKLVILNMAGEVLRSLSFEANIEKLGMAKSRIYPLNDYLFIHTFEYPGAWVVVNLQDNSIRQWEASEDISGEVTIIGNTIYFTSEGYRYKIKRLNLESGAIQQTMYWGAGATIGYYNGNLYFTHEEEHDEYSIRVKTVDVAASSPPQLVPDEAALTQAPVAAVQSSDNQGGDNVFMQSNELTVKYPSSKIVDRWGIINNTNVNLRSSATTKSQVISSFERGIRVWVYAEVINEGNEWYYINIQSSLNADTGNNYGFMMAKYIDLE